MFKLCASQAKRSKARALEVTCHFMIRVQAVALWPSVPPVCQNRILRHVCLQAHQDLVAGLRLQARYWATKMCCDASGIGPGTGAAPAQQW